MATTEGERMEEAYAEAWDRFGAASLWSLRRVAEPDADEALATARALRAAGGLEAHRLADRLDGVAGASVRTGEPSSCGVVMTKRRERA